MPNWGVEKAPDGGLRIFVDLSEHECQMYGAEQHEEPAAPAPGEPALGETEEDAPEGQT